MFSKSNQSGGGGDEINRKFWIFLNWKSGVRMSRGDGWIWEGIELISNLIHLNIRQIIQ